MTTQFRKNRRKEWWLVVFVLFGSRCAPQAEAAEAHRVVLAMGTRLEVSVTAQDTDGAWRATEAAIGAVDAVEERLSAWREDSDVSRINRAEVGRWVEVSPETVEDLASAVSWSQLTRGAFHPGLGALVGAWLGGAAGILPEAATLDELGAAADLKNLQIADLQVRRLHPLFRLDTGGFGKGVALRDAADAALNAGATSVDLNFGGQVMRAGQCGERPIQIADPQDRWSTVATCRLATGSLATSGNSERGIRAGSELIGHIIDPRTGQPSPFGGSVTVMAGDPVAADCLSTALFVLGPEAGMNWLESRPNLAVDALWISADGGKKWVTPGLQDRLTRIINQ
jgi:thiamine biosynthesis lipoprotein